MTQNPFAWSTNPDDNVLANTGIDISDTTAANAVDDAVREIMASVAAWRDLMTGAKTLGGAADAYVLTTGFSLASVPTAFACLVIVNATNTGASTLAIDGNTPIAITDRGGNALTAGEMTAGEAVWLVLQGSTLTLFRGEA